MLGKVFVFIAFVMASSAAVAAPVNINTADANAISENIKGVGPKKAEAIVAHRKSHGPFKSAQELINVKGIGQKTIDKNKENILISDSSQAKPDKDKAIKSR